MHAIHTMKFSSRCAALILAVVLLSLLAAGATLASALGSVVTRSAGDAGAQRTTAAAPAGHGHDGARH